MKSNNKTSEELTTLEDYVKNVDGQDYRKPDEKTENMPGMRFKAKVTTASKREEAAYVVEEYGYIFALERTLNANNEALTFDSVSKYVSGAAYVRNEFDKVFDSSIDGIHVFSGVLYGIPENEYSTNIVARTYTKIRVGEDTFVLYGDAMTANLGELMA